MVQGRITVEVHNDFAYGNTVHSQSEADKVNGHLHKLKVYDDFIYVLKIAVPLKNDFANIYEERCEIESWA